MNAYASLMKLTTESMKNKENIYLIQSTHAIIKEKLHASFGHWITLRLQKKKVSTPSIMISITLCFDTIVGILDLSNKNNTNFI